ncbi:hydantoinase/oxoprolinase family protein [Streptomyces iranensis]|uniref:hydantoinase/oxoprolinase family protein n=1 Tax=Streptomyces iranensis TaxID=576784 RepID=UPI0039B759BA
MIIGIDIGGTFTDGVLQGDGAVHRAKTLTTPTDLGDGVIAVCRLLAEKADVPIHDFFGRAERLTLGTTAVTNILTSQTGRRVGMLTTAGFEDELGISKGRRLNRDGWVVRPPELVARRGIRGIAERIDRDGDVLLELDVDQVLSAATELVRERGVEVLTVSYLWSHINPVHEELTEQVLRKAFPDVPVMCGSMLNPIQRGYERTTFAALNAYTSGAFSGLDHLEGRLRDLGLRGRLLVINCAGGAMTLSSARATPLRLVHSGPAAGVAAGAVVATEHRAPAAIACDMGGTSFDVALISDGAVTRTVRGEVFGTLTSLAHVDVQSIGAGGGSVAWIDSLGVLRLGPKSAGASPGPACYGRGGSDATITDALLVLGYIDPQAFLGGSMKLDERAAREACSRIGESLGLTTEEVAWGIRSIALNNMAEATRATVANRGQDPRTHAIISYGGCGSLFTAEIAKAIGIKRVIVPEVASVFSAYGAASSAVRRERTIAVGKSIPFDVPRLAEKASSIIAAVKKELTADGVDEEDRSISVEADLRFRRQVSDLTIAFPGPDVTPESVDHVVEEFTREYVRRYGRGALLLDATIDMVSLRVVGTGRQPAALPNVAEGTGEPEITTPSSSRSIQLERLGPRTDVPVFMVEDLEPGARIDGPACLDGADTTIWVPAGATARMDSQRTLLLDVESGNN